MNNRRLLDLQLEAMNEVLNPAGYLARGVPSTGRHPKAEFVKGEQVVGSIDLKSSKGDSHNIIDWARQKARRFLKGIELNELS